MPLSRSQVSFEAAVDALQLAGAIDDALHWIGGDMLVVQVGDQLDRGEGERRILDLLEDLRMEADAAGGGFHPLIGNHETMNVEMDLRYATPGGFADFADPNDPMLAGLEPGQRGRVAAFLPGGPYARMVAEHPMILLLEDTVFVHGGALPRHANYGIDAINAEVSAWMSNGMVWRVDVGLADYCGGPTQVLSLFGDEVHVMEFQDGAVGSGYGTMSA